MLISVLYLTVTLTAVEKNRARKFKQCYLSYKCASSSEERSTLTVIKPSQSNNFVSIREIFAKISVKKGKMSAKELF